MEKKQIYFSDDIAHRLGAIDIGSNSVRLIVAEPLRGGNYRILDEEREPDSPGSDAQLHGQIGCRGDRGNSGGASSLQANRWWVSGGRAAYHCNLRGARGYQSAGAVPPLCEQETGIDVEVISADAEVRLAFYSVQRAFDLAGKNIVLADIGGGSTELATGNAIESINTSPRVLCDSPRSTEVTSANLGTRFSELVEGIDRQLRKHTKKPPFAPHLLIGSGGTFTSLAEMIMAQKGQVDLPTRGYTITRAEVSHLLDRLRKISPRCAVEFRDLCPIAPILLWPDSLWSIGSWLALRSTCSNPLPQLWCARRIVTDHD